MKLTWSPLAFERMQEIGAYISADDPVAALGWTESIFDAVEQLVDFPASGRVVPEFKRHEVRELIRGRYRIIYRIDEEEIAILTVRHSRRILDPEEI